MKLHGNLGIGVTVFFDWRWNYKAPLVFYYIVLTKKLGICRSKEIRSLISWQMDLWEKGVNDGLVGDGEAEGAVREGIATR